MEILTVLAISGFAIALARCVVCFKLGGYRRRQAQTLSPEGEWAFKRFRNTASVR